MSAERLFVHGRESVSLADALKAYAAIAPEAVAVLYSPRACVFAVLSSGRLRDGKEGAVDLAEVFEARLFCPRAELRWLNVLRKPVLMDTTKARRELGWRPRHDAEETLRETVEGARAVGIV